MQDRYITKFVVYNKCFIYNVIKICTLKLNKLVTSCSFIFLFFFINISKFRSIYYIYIYVYFFFGEFSKYLYKYI